MSAVASDTGNNDDTDDCNAHEGTAATAKGTCSSAAMANDASHHHRHRQCHHKTQAP